MFIFSIISIWFHFFDRWFRIAFAHDIADTTLLHSSPATGLTGPWCSFRKATNTAFLSYYFFRWLFGGAAACLAWRQRVWRAYGSGCIAQGGGSEVARRKCASGRRGKKVCAAARQRGAGQAKRRVCFSPTAATFHYAAMVSVSHHQISHAYCPHAAST
jgi:hypothetical protein